MEKWFLIFTTTLAIGFSTLASAMEEEAEAPNISFLHISNHRQIVIGNPLSREDFNHVVQGKPIQTIHGLFKLNLAESCAVTTQVLKMQPVLVQTLYNRNLQRVTNLDDSAVFDDLSNGFVYYLSSSEGSKPNPLYSADRPEEPEKIECELWGGVLRFEKIQGQD